MHFTCMLGDQCVMKHHQSLHVRCVTTAVYSHHLMFWLIILFAPGDIQVTCAQGGANVACNASIVCRLNSTTVILLFVSL